MPGGPARQGRAGKSPCVSGCPHSLVRGRGHREGDAGALVQVVLGEGHLSSGRAKPSPAATLLKIQCIQEILCLAHLGRRDSTATTSGTGSKGEGGGRESPALPFFLPKFPPGDAALLQLGADPERW